MEGLDEARFLASSASRVELLCELGEEPIDLRDLRDELEIPRTTLQRNLKKLEKRGWIEESREGYSVTKKGELIVEAFTNFLETVRGADALATFVTWVDPGLVDTRHLKKISGTASTEEAPEAARQRLLNRLRESESSTAILPALSVDLFRDLSNLAIDGRSRVNLVVDRKTEDTLRDECPSELKDALEAGVLDLRIRSEIPPYGLVVTDTALILLGFDEDSLPRALLETEAEESMEWGNMRCRLAREEAEPSLLTIAFSPGFEV